jgi:enamine deaminase RidA (YjgF/YER057c/UK114 family)
MVLQISLPRHPSYAATMYINEGVDHDTGHHTHVVPHFRRAGRVAARLRYRRRHRGGRRRGGRHCAGAGAADAALFKPARNVKPADLQPRGRGHRPHRTIYLAGQTGVDASGKPAEGIRAQAVQVFENIKTALASVGGGFEHIVKLTSYLTNMDEHGVVYREVRASYFPNKAALPASTLLQISRLANPAYLLEVEVVAIMPPRA